MLSVPRLVSLENTVNFHSGKIVPLGAMRELREVTARAGLATHLDGARLLNACVASGVDVRDYAATADSLSMCFTKGLGAPFGSVLAGDREFIERARVFRQWFGGSLRQSGIMAAAALYAIEHHVERLADDHANARLLVTQLAHEPGLSVTDRVETNIVVVDISGTGTTADRFVAEAERAGVRLLAWTPSSVRLVTRIGVEREDILLACARIAEVARRLARRAA